MIVSAFTNFLKKDLKDLSDLKFHLHTKISLIKLNKLNYVHVVVRAVCVHNIWLIQKKSKLPSRKKITHAIIKA